MDVPNFLGICMIMELCVTNKPPALKMYVKKKTLKTMTRKLIHALILLAFLTLLSFNLKLPCIAPRFHISFRLQKNITNSVVVLNVAWVLGATPLYVTDPRMYVIRNQRIFLKRLYNELLKLRKQFLVNLNVCLFYAWYRSIIVQTWRNYDHWHCARHRWMSPRLRLILSQVQTKSHCSLDLKSKIRSWVWGIEGLPKTILGT